MPERDRLPLPLHRGRRAGRRGAPGRPRRVGRGQGRGQRGAAVRHADAVRRRGLDAAARRSPPRSRPAGGCSRSATVAARPTRPRSPPSSPARPGAGRCPARCLVEDTAIVTALANDVGFDLVFSRQLIAHAAPQATSPSAFDERRLPQRARPLRRGEAAGHASPSAWPATTAARWPPRRTCSTAWSSAPTASTGSRRRRPRSASPSGTRSSSAGARGSTMADAAGARRPPSSTASRPSGAAGPG